MDGTTFDQLAKMICDPQSVQADDWAQELEDSLQLLPDVRGALLAQTQVSAWTSAGPTSICLYYSCMVCL